MQSRALHPIGFPSGSLGTSHSWTFGPPVNHEKVSGAGVPARQPVCTDWKACATGKTFQAEAKKLFLVPKLPLGNPIAGKATALREPHLFIAPCAPSRSLGTREKGD